MATPGTILLIIIVGLCSAGSSTAPSTAWSSRASKGIVAGVIAGSKAGDFWPTCGPGNNERRKQRAQTMGRCCKSIASVMILAVAI